MAKRYKDSSLRVVDLEQGTADWLDWRARRVTASEAAIAMDCTPPFHEVRTWDDLRRAKREGQPTPEPATAEIFAHGHRWEPVAREIVSVVWGDGPSEDADTPAGPWSPLCLEREIFGASLDGCLAPKSMTWPENRNGLHWPPVWLEIKCPWRGRDSATWREVAAVSSRRHRANPRARDGIPPHIWWQMVHQAGTLYGDVPRERMRNHLAALVVFCPPRVYATRAIGDGEMLDRLRGTAWGWDRRQATAYAASLLEDSTATVLVSVRRLLEDWPRLEREWRDFWSGRDRRTGMLRDFP